MADLAALREAEALVELADAVAGRIAAEIAAMTQALETARESLARVERTSAACVEHAGLLGLELRRGRAHQEQIVIELQEGAAVLRALWESSFLSVEAPPALTSASHLPLRSVRAGTIQLPEFATPTREDLRREPLPLSAQEEWWDLLARDQKTFQERHEEAVTALEAAEDLARKSAEPPRREPRKPREAIRPQATDGGKAGPRKKPDGR